MDKLNKCEKYNDHTKYRLVGGMYAYVLQKKINSRWQLCTYEENVEYYFCEKVGGINVKLRIVT